MAGVYSDNTKIKTPNKEWKDKIAYDKTRNEDQVRAIQTVLYGSNQQNAKYNANIDGKWGENSQRRFNKAGFKMADDWSYYIDGNGRKYVWQGKMKGYVGEPAQKNPDDELWYNLSDSRQREAQNWINRQKAAGKDVGIRDWYKMNNMNHQSLQATARFGAQAGYAITEELVPLAITAGAQAGSRSTSTHKHQVRPTNRETWVNPSKNSRVNTTVSETVARGGTGTPEGTTGPAGTLYNAENVVEGKLYRYGAGTERSGSKVGGQWTTESPVITATTDVGVPMVVPYGTPIATGRLDQNEYMPGLGIATMVEGTRDYVRERREDNQRHANLWNPNGEYVYTYRDNAGNTNIGVNWGRVGNTLASKAKNAVKATVKWLGDVNPTPHNAGTNRLMRKEGGVINKFLQGGNMDLQQMIQAFAQWGALKFGKGQMSPEQFLQQFQQLDQLQQLQLLQAFQQEAQGGSVMAKLGAKLNYIKRLKEDCPEGQELVYFKKGGRVCKACADKKQNGGTADEIANFKKTRMEKCGGKTKKAACGVKVDKCGGKAK